MDTNILRNYKYYLAYYYKKTCPTLNVMFKCNLTDEDIRKVSGSRLGWYRRFGLKTANYLLSPKVLSIKKADRPGLVNPLEYYLSN